MTQDDQLYEAHQRALEERDRYKEALERIAKGDYVVPASRCSYCPVTGVEVIARAALTPGDEGT